MFNILKNFSQNFPGVGHVPQTPLAEFWIVMTNHAPLPQILGSAHGHWENNVPTTKENLN